MKNVGRLIALVKLAVFIAIVYTGYQRFQAIVDAINAPWEKLKSILPARKGDGNDGDGDGDGGQKGSESAGNDNAKEANPGDKKSTKEVETRKKEQVEIVQPPIVINVQSGSKVAQVIQVTQVAAVVILVVIILWLFRPKIAKRAHRFAAWFQNLASGQNNGQHGNKGDGGQNNGQHGSGGKNNDNQDNNEVDEDDVVGDESDGSEEDDGSDNNNKVKEVAMSNIHVSQHETGLCPSFVEKYEIELENAKNSAKSGQQVIHDLQSVDEVEQKEEEQEEDIKFGQVVATDFPKQLMYGGANMPETMDTGLLLKFKNIDNGSEKVCFVKSKFTIYKEKYDARGQQRVTKKEAKAAAQKAEEEAAKVDGNGKGAAKTPLQKWHHKANAAQHKKAKIEKWKKLIVQVKQTIKVDDPNNYWKHANLKDPAVRKLIRKYGKMAKEINGDPEILKILREALESADAANAAKTACSQKKNKKNKLKGADDNDNTLNGGEKANNAGANLQPKKKKIKKNNKGSGKKPSKADGNNGKSGKLQNSEGAGGKSGKLTASKGAGKQPLKADGNNDKGDDGNGGQKGSVGHGNKKKGAGAGGKNGKLPASKGAENAQSKPVNNNPNGGKEVPAKVRLVPDEDGKGQMTSTQGGKGGKSSLRIFFGGISNGTGMGALLAVSNSLPFAQAISVGALGNFVLDLTIKPAADAAEFNSQYAVVDREGNCLRSATFTEAFCAQFKKYDEMIVGSLGATAATCAAATLFTTASMVAVPAGITGFVTMLAVEAAAGGAGKVAAMRCYQSIKGVVGWGASVKKDIDTIAGVARRTNEIINAKRL